MHSQIPLFRRKRKIFIVASHPKNLTGKFDLLLLSKRFSAAQKRENERVATFYPEAFSSAAKPRSFSRYFSQCKFHYRRKITPFPRHRGHCNFQSSQLNKTLSSIEAALATAADRSGGVLPQKLRTKRGNGLRSERTRTVPLSRSAAGEIAHTKRSRRIQQLLYTFLWRRELTCTEV